MFRWASILGARTAVMGVLNVTPDSFSDGGAFVDPERAVAHGRALAADGAVLVDVGGESTRPGAEPVDETEEIRRTEPVVRELARSGVAVSIDTTKAAVAAAALDAGAVVVNDVSAGRFDPLILSVTARAGAGFVAMHMQGEPRTMQLAPEYDDVVREVGDFLAERLDAAQAAGIPPDALMADPGIGFGKTVDHNLALLAGLPELIARLPAPVLVGTSRKSFIGTLLGARELEARDAGTLATVAWCAEHGAAMVRVHDARGAGWTVRMVDAVLDARRAFAVNGAGR